jgi:hypothetical protein
MITNEQLQEWKVLCWDATPKGEGTFCPDAPPYKALLCAAIDAMPLLIAEVESLRVTNESLARREIARASCCVDNEREALRLRAEVATLQNMVALRTGDLETALVNIGSAFTALKKLAKAAEDFKALYDALATPPKKTP